MRGLPSIAFVLPSLVCSAAIAATHVIAPDGTGDHPTIKAAIQASAPGDSIVLLDGVFTGNDNSDVRFGGLAVTLRSQSGDPTLCTIDCGGTRRGVTFLFEDETTLVEGITFLNGAANDGGGFFFNDATTPIVRNCIVAQSTAELGGGLYAEDGAAPTIEDCVFIDNVAFDGGGGYVFRGASPSFEGCLFAGNEATRQGGALYCGLGASPRITSSTLSDNVAGELGDVLFLHASSEPVLEASVVWDEGASAPGIIHIWDGSCLLTLDCVVYPPEAIGGRSDRVNANQAITTEPMFCAVGTSYPELDETLFTVSTTSPCLPENNACNRLLGARGMGCDAMPVLPITWSGIKARFSR